MRIACLIDNLGSGGAQRQLVNLAVGFHERGHDVRVITYYPNEFYSQVLYDNGIVHTRVNRTNAWKRMMNIRRALRTGTQDAVLAFLESPSLWAELAAIPSRRWGLVVSERSGPSTVSSLKGRLMRCGHYMADAVTVNSVSTAEVLVLSMPRLRGHIHTIYNAVDLRQFCPPDRYVPRSQGRATVVVAASYRNLKNLHGLIEAVTLLGQEMRAQLEITWYGDRHDDAYDTGVEMVRDRCLEDVFKLNGTTSDIERTMKQADAVGLFSFVEGLPNSVCEGMACGKPIIMSRISDAEVLVEPGENGWLCEPGDPRSIAAALRSFLSVRDERLVVMGRRSRSKAERLFATDKVVTRYLDLLGAAAAAHRRRRCPRGVSYGHFAAGIADAAARDDKKDAERQKCDGVGDFTPGGTRCVSG